MSKTTINYRKKEIENKAQKISEKLLATDFYQNSFVVINHSDGSTFTFMRAFVILTDNCNYVMVFSEHHGFHIFYGEDIPTWRSNDVRRIMSCSGTILELIMELRRWWD